ncbi:MAG: integrin alpha, partial [Flavobacteriales bacterium]
KNAVYPITIDPISISYDQKITGPKSGNFGISVSNAGDVNNDGKKDVLVGAYTYDNGNTDEGMAFIYRGTSNGLSTSASWSGESNSTDAYYGSSVSTAGDVNNDGISDVVIGAKHYDNSSNSLPEDGRVYIYMGSNTGVNNTPNGILDKAQAYAHFGTSVSAAGDVDGDNYDDVIVGAPDYDNGHSNEGMVFLYSGSSSGISTSSAWQAESNQDDASMGKSVSNAGDVNSDNYDDVVIGAPQYDNNAVNDGMIYVYYGSGTGLSSSPSWTFGSGNSGSAFGSSVSYAGDVNGDGEDDIIAGAKSYENGESFEGAA